MPETPAPDPQKVRFARLLNAVVDYADDVAPDSNPERPAVTHYMRQQVNTIRGKLAEGDELLAQLFPVVPEDTGIHDVATIARQLLDYLEEPGPSIGERAAKAAKQGLHITGENVSVLMSDMAELGVQIRERVAELMADAMRPGAPKTPEDIDSRIAELEKAVREYTERIGTDNTPDVQDTVNFSKVARELAFLKGRKAGKGAKPGSGSEGCCGPEDSSDDDCCPPSSRGGCCG